MNETYNYLRISEYAHRTNSEVTKAAAATDIRSNTCNVVGAHYYRSNNPKNHRVSEKYFSIIHSLWLIKKKDRMKIQIFGLTLIYDCDSENILMSFQIKAIEISILFAQTKNKRMKQKLLLLIFLFLSCFFYWRNSYSNVWKKWIHGKNEHTQKNSSSQSDVVAAFFIVEMNAINAVRTHWYIHTHTHNERTLCAARIHRSIHVICSSCSCPLNLYRLLFFAWFSPIHTFQCAAYHSRILCSFLCYCSPSHLVSHSLRLQCECFG